MQIIEFRVLIASIWSVSSLRLKVAFYFLMMACAALSSAQNKCVPPTSGMIAWWPGDGNAKDISGSGNNGMFVNEEFTPTNCDPDAPGCGKVRQAFSFDGLNEVEIKDASSLHFGTGDITVEGWINASPGTAFRTFVGKENQSFPFPSLIFRLAPNGHLQFAVTDCGTGACGFSGPSGGGSRQPVESPNPVDDGQFHHIAGVRQSGGYILYVDGDQVATRSEEARDGDSDASLFLGIQAKNSVNGSFNLPYEGFLDELSIYKRALSEEEIQAIVKAGSAGKCKISYRLPFSGQFPITNGPTCGTGKNTHTGFTQEAIDYGLPLVHGQGTPVLAAEAGEVLCSACDPFALPGHDLTGFGTYIVVQHVDGSRSFYAHLLNTAVLTGDQVSKGQVIAFSGDSGRANGRPHLHFQIQDANDQPASIRELPFTMWFSGNPTNPCNPKQGHPDGEAIGPSVP